MKIHTLLIITSLTVAVSACSKHSQPIRFKGTSDTWVIDVSSGKPSIHTLPDGVICIITPTVLSGETISQISEVFETNGLKHTITNTLPAISVFTEIREANGLSHTNTVKRALDQPFMYRFDSSNAVTVTLRK